MWRSRIMHRATFEERLAEEAPTPTSRGLEGTMELRYDTAKRYPKFNYDSLAEQMRELRELRKLVRSAEAKRRNGRRAPQHTGRGLFKLH
jgi:hypothetical protein